MALDVVYADDDSGVIVTGTGGVSVGEILAVKGELITRSGRKNLRWMVWHLPDGILGDTPVSDLRQMAVMDAELCKLNRNLLLAIVLKDAQVRTQTRIYMLYANIWAGQMTTRIFHELSEAQAWIRRESEKVAAV